MNLGNTKSSASLELMAKPQGSLSAGAAPRNELPLEDENYFTVHRYIPTSALLRSRRTDVHSGHFKGPRLFLPIPKASRFMVAKVKMAGDIGESKLDTIEERDSAPLLDCRGDVSQVKFE